MKVATLLSHYLYAQKKLTLAGIGSFSMDSDYTPDPDQKAGKSVIPSGISFSENINAPADDGFTAFVSAQTGKMKALAAADIESYLTLARQFLNIGKPFQIEGIGTLVKTRSGFEFTPGIMTTEKLKEIPGIKDHTASAHAEESFIGYDDVYNNSGTKEKNKKRKLLLGAVTIAGLLLAIAAGYYISQNWAGRKTNTESATDSVSNNTQPAEEKAKDTLTSSPQPPAASQAAPVPAGSYKFIIEEAGRDRALKRFETLQKGGNKFLLETSDSASFRIYTVINAAPADTAKIIDSLSSWFPALNKRRAYIQ